MASGLCQGRYGNRPLSTGQPKLSGEVRQSVVFPRFHVAERDWRGADRRPSRLPTSVSGLQFAVQEWSALGMRRNEPCNRGHDLVLCTIEAVIGERAARRKRHPPALVDDDL